MKVNSILFLGILIAAIFVIPVVAQLSSRGGQLEKRYGEDRVKGLTLLNKRYIERLQKEQAIALQKKRLEEANKIQAHIKRLEAENKELSERDQEMTNVQIKANSEIFLVGKTIGFPWNRDPSQVAYFSFQKKGKALWLGTNNQAIPRNYRHTGELRQYLLWWSSDNEKLGDYRITIGPQGKTAEMLEVTSGKITVGVVKRTR